MGRGSARAPYIAFSNPAPFVYNDYGLDGNMNTGESMSVMGVGQTDYIHPDVAIKISRISQLQLISVVPDLLDEKISSINLFPIVFAKTF